jgi:enterochelin esterase-like enzyme
MQLVNQQAISTEIIDIESGLLQRSVRIECFWPAFEKDLSSLDLLLINDGQNMQELGFGGILESLLINNSIIPLVCVGIYAGDRIMEYGTADVLDYLGRGYKASLYSRFILEELIPFVKNHYKVTAFRQQSMAGFSLGGLSALDIVWRHPNDFKKVGVFSGSLWWRTKGLDDGYDEDTDRIMHTLVRNGKYTVGLKFFFEAGALDETMDRNQNGIIDAIDDTLDLIDELVRIGYHVPQDVLYLELQEGRHDIATWAKAMPEFLKWVWER